MDSAERTDAERCPACGAPIEPEAATCACGFVFGVPADEVPTDGELEFGEVVDVHRCTMSEGMAIQAALGAHGLRVFIADEQTKTIDPFVIGGNAWAVTLRAPVEDADRVREKIRALEAAHAERAGPPTSHSHVLVVLALLGFAVCVAGWLVARVLFS